MPLDHYVSQVHLANFCSLANGKARFWGIRKHDLHVFPCKTKDVCRVQDGSTNSYLGEPRAIEEFLKTVEPYYNRALSNLRQGKPTVDDVYVMSGFIAYVAACSPSAMRLQSEPLRAAVDATSRMLEACGKLRPLPPVLGADSLSELLDDGRVKINIDGKYPQAMGIAGIRHFQLRFGNAAWEILHNDFEDSPFFTSDFPAAIADMADNRIMARVVPLAPDLAVRIVPDLEDLPPEPEFPRFRFRNVKLTRQDVRSINTTVVRCAEETIFFRDNQAWVVPFVRKHQGFHAVTLTDRIPTEGGHFLLNRIRVRPKT